MSKYFFILFVCLSFNVQAQNDSIFNSLKKEYEKTKDLSAKLEVLQKLGAYSEILSPDSTADFVNEGILLAEQSRQKNLMIKARRVAAGVYLGSGTDQVRMLKAKKYALEALEISKGDNIDVVELAHSNILMGRVERFLGNATKGVSYNLEAIDIANKSDDDSLKVSAYLSCANTYLFLDEKIKAFKNYLAAQDVVEKSKNKNTEILSLFVKNNFVNFYLKVEDYDKAIDFQYQILDYYKAQNKKEEQLSILQAIAQNYLAAKKYDVAKATYLTLGKLSDSLKNTDYKTMAEFGKLNVYIETKDKDNALAFLKKNDSLLGTYKKYGMQYKLDEGFANMYHELGMNDSALIYYKKALPIIDIRGTLFGRAEAHYYYGNHLYTTKNYNAAINELKIAESLCDSSNYLSRKLLVLNILDSCYQRVGDFKNAYIYSTKYREVQKLLDEKGKEKEVLSLEIAAANKLKEHQLKEDKEETQKRHYWQYSLILMIIISLFIMLAAFGVFKVSVRWIRVIGFFSFILLFEFIILLADTWIHHATHGEPWKILGIKVLLIALLMPLHHFLEHKVISFITSKYSQK